MTILSDVGTTKSEDCDEAKESSHEVRINRAGWGIEYSVWLRRFGIDIEVEKGPFQKITERCTIKLLQLRATVIVVLLRVKSHCSSTSGNRQAGEDIFRAKSQEGEKGLC